MIHSDGRATISNREGEAALQEALNTTPLPTAFCGQRFDHAEHVWCPEGHNASRLAQCHGYDGIGKPKLVEDVIARDSAPAVDPAMAHGAARAFATIRESITDGTCKTLNDVLALSAVLQLTYESLIRT